MLGAMWALPLLVLLALSPAAIAASPIEITRAEYLATDARTPPPDDANWQNIKLPYAPRGIPVVPPESTLWFRFNLARPESTDDIQLYIWRHNVSLEVFMNGTRIAGVRSDADPPPMGWNIPLLMQVQPGNWRDTNVFHVRLSGGRFGSMLSSVLVGKKDDLEPLYRTRYFWQVETSKWTFDLSILLAVFTFWLWTRRRQDSMYLLFAASSFSWAILTAYFYIDFIPMPLPLWLGVIHTAGTWCSYFLVCFINRAVGFNLPRMERAMLVFVSIATVLHFIYPEGHFFIVAYALHAIGLGFLMFVASLVFRDAYRNPGETSTWFALAFIGLVALILHDWYFFMSSPKEQYVRASNLMQLAIPLMLVMLFIHLVNRFVSALNESETLNRDLETRVEAHRQALEESFQQNRMMEIRQGAAKEREKIYRDLHDDVGSKLVSIVHAGTDRREVDLARSALESLREAIYRANYQDQSLSQFVEDVTIEMQVRAENAGLRLDWQQAKQLPEIVLPSQVCYHLTRICREILSNILHHSRATAVQVILEATSEHIRCVIRDNGVGFDVRNDGGNSGSGIKNVRYRASQIGGTAYWCSEPNAGTEVTLAFPNPELAPFATS